MTRSFSLEIPYLIWREIISTAIGKEHKEYCFVSKLWFQIGSGRFCHIELLPLVPKLVATSPSWFQNRVTSLSIRRSDNIDYNHLSKCPNIQTLYLGLFDVENLSSSKQLVHNISRWRHLVDLKIHVDESGYHFLWRCQFLNVLHHRLRNLHLHFNTYDLHSHYLDSCLYNLYFPELHTLSLVINQTSKFVLNKFLHQMPKLKKLTLKIRHLSENDFHLSQPHFKLEHLNIQLQCNEGDYDLISIDLNHFQNLQSLQVPSKVQLLNTSNSQLSCLSLYGELLTPITFPRLKTLTLEATYLDSSSLFRILNQTSNVTSLTLQHCYSNLFLVNPPTLPYLKYLHLFGTFHEDLFNCWVPYLLPTLLALNLTLYDLEDNTAPLIINGFLNFQLTSLYVSTDSNLVKSTFQSLLETALTIPKIHFQELT